MSLPGPAEDRGRLHLPEHPEPVEIELELTNACNARCQACPRDDMPRSGIMSEATLELILDAYDGVREGLALNQVYRGLRYPRVTIAGGGEPLLHPEALGFMRRVVERGYGLHVVTNASRLDAARTEELLALGPSSIAVSFWGIEPDEYEAAMRLPYATTLRKVERLGAAAKDAGVPLCVTWVDVPAIHSPPERIREFWRERGIEVDVSDNYAWNRGGLLELVPSRRAAAVMRRPDPSRRVWCADFFFTDTFDWQGRMLLCCCNYFTGRQLVIGHLREHTLEQLMRRKAELLVARPLPAMCQVCEQPRSFQARWLAEPWLARLDERERASLTYEPIDEGV
jgi:hypothetical protein